MNQYQQIVIQTPDGPKEYLYVPNSVEYDRAVADGKITEGMEIVYRQYLVHILSDMSMLILVQIMPAQPNVTWTFTGGPQT